MRTINGIRPNLRPVTEAFSDNIGSTPAMVNRETGLILKNSNVWDDLPQPYRAFIIEHEKGHYYLQTTSELEADHYAFKQLAGKYPESLKNTVRVLSDVLPYSSPMHGLRLLNMYRLALGFDYENEPTAERLSEIRSVENEILKNFANNPEFMEYIYSQQKTASQAKYEFPGYNPANFDPSIGRWFRDFPVSQPAQAVPWPVSSGSATAALKNAPAPELVEGVPIDLIPDFTLTTVTLDLRTVVICFLVLIAISIINKI